VLDLQGKFDKALASSSDRATRQEVAYHQPETRDQPNQVQKLQLQLQEENDQLTNALAASSEEVARHQLEPRHLQQGQSNAQEQASAVIVQHAALEGQLSIRQNKLEKAHQALTNFKSEADDKQAAGVERFVLEHQLKKSQNELVRNQNEAVMVSTARETVLCVEKELREEQLKTCEAELEKVQEQLIESRDRAETIGRECTACKEELRASAQALTSTHQQSDKLQHDKVKLEGHVVDLELQIVGITCALETDKEANQRQSEVSTHTHTRTYTHTHIHMHVHTRTHTHTHMHTGESLGKG